MRPAAARATVGFSSPRNAPMNSAALLRRFAPGLLALCALLLSITAAAADFPAPQSATWIARDFKFSSGETMPELRIRYTTVGAPTGEPVLVLHGTTGSAASMLTPLFAGELFGAGQPLDATKYFIILPDAIGHGGTSKPSDSLRAKFPRYNYEDMVAAQHRLVTEGLGIKHLRLVIGNSMGGMHTWLWGVNHPDFLDALAPMASQPTEMASRNWMLRRLITDSIRNDPEWNGGNYTAQPKSARFASVFYGIATNGGTLAYQKAAPTRAQADKVVDERLAAPFTGDANDVLYQWDSSRDYNVAPKLDRIKAALLVINAADDERNPPETGLMERELKRVPGAKLHLIPASDDTSGHGTTGRAKFYAAQLKQLLQTAPKR
jgi:homoserine O-acetyltransferase/O-succinyltransferase